MKAIYHLLAIVLGGFLAPVTGIFAQSPPTGCALFSRPTDTILINGHTVVSDQITMEAEIFIPSSLAAPTISYPRIFEEQQAGVMDKAFWASPSFVGGSTYIYDNMGPQGWGPQLGATNTGANDSWHHLAFVHDSNELRVYLDGSEIGVQDYAGDPSIANSGGSTMSIGAFLYNGGQYTTNSFLGALRWLRVSSIARYSGTSITPPATVPTSDPSTQILFDFSALAPGTTNVYDLGPNHFTGTVGTGFNGATAPSFVPPNMRQTATAIAVWTNGFVISAIITENGSGYTNTPVVRIIGGGGTGAAAVAVVSNGMVIAVNITNAGRGYTNAPIILINPPYFNPALGSAGMSYLKFSNLTVGGEYQLQQVAGGYYWTNLPVNFTASNSVYSLLVNGANEGGNYRLTLAPAPAQAFAVPQVLDGFVVGATVTSGGSGYVTSPLVTIDGYGTNAGAYSEISDGVVTNIVITNAGTGYTNVTTIEIGNPPAAAISPTSQLVIRLDSSNLLPYENYQIQFLPNLGATWVNWNGGLFSPTQVTNSQYLFVTNSTGYFRVQYLP